MIRLAVDALPALVPSGGIGRYVNDLVRALETEPGAPAATLVYPGNLDSQARARFPDAARRALPLGWRGMRLLYALPLPPGVGLDGMFGRPDVYHATMGIAPILRGARTIVTVHDLTAIEHPDWHPAAVVGLTRATLPRAIARADVVVCDSDHVRERVLTRYGRSPADVVTVHLPLSPGLPAPPAEVARETVAARFGITGPFVLQVGTLEPRKDHRTSLAAYEQLCERGFPGPFVWAGREGWHVEPLRARLAESPVRDRVRRIHDLDDATLAALYASATASVMPSLDEGFGLPVLESMARGCPCVCSDRGSLPEVAGEGAPRFAAGDAHALADALERLWRDPEFRAREVARGLARAGTFGFAAWARRMFAIYAGAPAAAPAAAVPEDPDRTASSR